MIDIGWLGHIEFTWHFLGAVMSIVLIDLVLAGDNAVVIAMAVRNLPGKRRLWGITLGSGAAVVVRLLATLHLLMRRLWRCRKSHPEGKSEEAPCKGWRQIMTSI